MAKKTRSLVAVEQIDGMIRTIRGVRVMLDRDLAKIYGVPTFRFNEAIKRNRHRFPADFMFQLTPAEFDRLKAQSANSSQIAMSYGKHAAAAGVGRALMLLLSMAPYRLQMFFAVRAPFR